MPNAINKSTTILQAKNLTNPAFTAVDRNLSKMALSLKGFVGFAAFTAITTGLTRMISKTLDAGDRIQKLSISLGASTENLSQLAYAAELSGLEFESLAKGMQKLQKSASEAELGLLAQKRAFYQLGLNVSDFKRLIPTDQLKALADALQSIENPADRIRIRMDLLGRSGGEFAALFKEGSAGITKMQKKLDDLGGTLSQVAADDMAATNDAASTLGTSFNSLGIEITKLSTGPLIYIFEGLTKFLQGQGLLFNVLTAGFFFNPWEDFAGKFGEGVDGFEKETKRVRFLYSQIDFASKEAQKALNQFGPNSEAEIFFTDRVKNLEIELKGLLNVISGVNQANASLSRQNINEFADASQIGITTTAIEDYIAKMYEVGLATTKTAKEKFVFQKVQAALLAGWSKSIPEIERESGKLFDQIQAINALAIEKQKLADEEAAADKAKVDADAAKVAAALKLLEIGKNYTASVKENINILETRLNVGDRELRITEVLNSLGGEGTKITRAQIGANLDLIDSLEDKIAIQRRSKSAAESYNRSARQEIKYLKAKISGGEREAKIVQTLNRLGGQNSEITRATIGANIDLIKSLEDQIDQQEKVKAVIGEISDAMAGAIIEGENLGDAMKSIFKKIARDILASGIKSAIGRVFFGSGSGGGGGGSFGSSFLSGFSNSLGGQIGGGGSSGGGSGGGGGIVGSIASSIVGSSAYKSIANSAFGKSVSGFFGGGAASVPGIGSAIAPPSVLSGYTAAYSGSSASSVLAAKSAGVYSGSGAAVSGIGSAVAPPSVLAGTSTAATSAAATSGSGAAASGAGLSGAATAGVLALFYLGFNYLSSRGAKKRAKAQKDFVNALNTNDYTDLINNKSIRFSRNDSNGGSTAALEVDSGLDDIFGRIAYESGGKVKAVIDAGNGKTLLRISRNLEGVAKTFSRLTEAQINQINTVSTTASNRAFEEARDNRGGRASGNIGEFWRNNTYQASIARQVVSGLESILRDPTGNTSLNIGIPLSREDAAIQRQEEYDLRFPVEARRRNNGGGRATGTFGAFESVPSGFPNDTYSIGLTSGEEFMVLSPTEVQNRKTNSAPAQQNVQQNNDRELKSLIRENTIANRGLAQAIEARLRGR